MKKETKYLISIDSECGFNIEKVTGTEKEIDEMVEEKTEYGCTADAIYDTELDVIIKMLNDVKNQ